MLGMRISDIATDTVVSLSYNDNETNIPTFLVEYSIRHTLSRNISRGWKLREILQPWVQYILIFHAEEGWNICNIYMYITKIININTGKD